ncbi:hypothetical protein [Paenibacillus silvae]|uniref:hypothetical protein n=1 Tax=Paenibacillus silvae TaxID=1325358 RepID=UPI002002D076|nr:hypothetical protein [Paenibacillus silvae]MCK6077085.1 hypothetical protein [Paenibacillus silvae]MCK6151283.1 hypothetical protein [Paenibacillus silvae]MCK6269771.1 hypothetical protein [Paenibacillus silvae]
MEKREQVGAEELKTHSLNRKQKKVRPIAQARAAYEQLMEKFVSTCQQAREFREQAAELQRSGRTDFRVRGEIQQRRRKWYRMQRGGWNK